MVGSEPLPRGEVVSKVWDYIKKHNLQNPENRREILADDKLEPVFGKKKVTMFEMNKHLAQHLTSPDSVLHGCIRLSQTKSSQNNVLARK